MSATLGAQIIPFTPRAQPTLEASPAPRSAIPASVATFDRVQAAAVDPVEAATPAPALDSGQERLAHALARLNDALAQQRAAIAGWRGAIADLSGSMETLRDSMQQYQGSLGTLDRKVAGLRAEAGRLEHWAHSALTVPTEPAAD